MNKSKLKSNLAKLSIQLEELIERGGTGSGNFGHGGRPGHVGGSGGAGGGGGSVNHEDSKTRVTGTPGKKGFKIECKYKSGQPSPEALNLFAKGVKEGQKVKVTSDYNYAGSHSRETKEATIKSIRTDIGKKKHAEIKFNNDAAPSITSIDQDARNYTVAVEVL